MTFYITPFLVTGMREDTFALLESDGRYFFCGATLTSGKYEPNSFFWDKYYALGSGLGIGCIARDVALIMNGKEVAVVNDVLDPTEPVSHTLFWGTVEQEKIWLTDPVLLFSWQKIKKALETHDSAQSRTILGAMTEWESRTRETFWQLSFTPIVCNWHSSFEMYISERQWLLHDYNNGQITIGKGTNIEATITIPVTKRLLSGATPVDNGWLVVLSHENRYLLCQDNHGVKLQPMSFPRGGWEKHGQWVYWPRDFVLLLPSGYMVTVPTHFTMLGASLDFALFKRYQASEIMLIDRSGGFHYADISKYGKNPKLVVGDKSVLIDHASRSGYLFSLVSLDQPLFRQKWQAAALPRHASYKVYAIRGDPDVFVVIYRLYGLNELSICLISATGKAWKPPISFCIPHGQEEFFVAVTNNRVVIEPCDNKRKPMGFSIIVEALGETGFVHLGTEATLMKELNSFGDRKSRTLQDRLLSDEHE